MDTNKPNSGTGTVWGIVGQQRAAMRQ